MQSAGHPLAVTIANRSILSARLRTGESAVSYLLGLSEIRQIVRLSESRAKPAPLVA
jgi:hypothetical protein